MRAHWEAVRALTIGQVYTADNITVKRCAKCYLVRTPHGNRRLERIADVMTIFSGRWPCSVCGRGLARSQFHNTNKRGKVYLRGDCKECERFRVYAHDGRRTRAYRQRHAAEMRQWRAENAERYRIQVKRWRLSRSLKRAA